MSNITITETCCCGARYEGAGYMVYVERQIEQFREAHAVCRDRLTEPLDRPYLLPQPEPCPGMEEE